LLPDGTFHFNTGGPDGAWFSIPQNLSWMGLTNVIYNLQGVSNLPGTRTTLGRAVNSATNFNFTNWDAGPEQFYRLVVPN
jgi:hypothetical protein